MKQRDDTNAATNPQRKVSTSNFQMSLNALICMESYYFHVYVVSCDVLFRYSDDAFMWTA